MILKRIGAYIIDIFIVLILCNVISLVLPNHDKVVSMTEESNEIVTEYYQALLNDEDNLEEYSIKLNDFSYRLTKVSIYTNLSSIVLYFLYFIVFQSYNSGQTVGKRLLKIETVGNDDEEVTFKQLFIRGIILYPILFNLLDIIVILLFKQSVYENLSVILALAKYVLFVLCVFPLFFGKKGLHDKLANTNVIAVGSDIKEESKATKWKKTADKEQEIKKYRKNHTSGKRKE